MGAQAFKNNDNAYAQETTCKFIFKNPSRHTQFHNLPNMLRIAFVYIFLLGIRNVLSLFTTFKNQRGS